MTKVFLLNRYVKAIPSLMHEITHSIEDRGLIKKGKTLGGELGKIGYAKFATYNNGGYTHMICDLLYYLNYYESNAYVTQMSSELDLCDRHFNTINDIFDYIKSTPTYKKYQIMVNIADVLSNNDLPESSKDGILTAISDNSNYKFATYNQFVKFLKERLYKIKRKFDNLMPKIAYNHEHMFKYETKPVKIGGLNEIKYDYKRLLEDLKKPSELIDIF